MSTAYILKVTYVLVQVIICICQFINLLFEIYYLSGLIATASVFMETQANFKSPHRNI